MLFDMLLLCVLFDMFYFFMYFNHVLGFDGNIYAKKKDNFFKYFIASSVFGIIDGDSEFRIVHLVTLLA